MSFRKPLESQGKPDRSASEASESSRARYHRSYTTYQSLSAKFKNRLQNRSPKLEQDLLALKAKQQQIETKSSPLAMLQEVGLLIKSIDSLTTKNIRNASGIERKLQKKISTVLMTTKLVALERKEVAAKELKNAFQAKLKALESAHPTNVLVILMREYCKYIEDHYSVVQVREAQNLLDRHLFLNLDVMQILTYSGNTCEDEQFRCRAALAILQSADSNDVLKFFVAAAFDSVVLSSLSFDKAKLNELLEKDHTAMIENAIQFLQVEVQRAEQEILKKEREREVAEELDCIDEEEKPKSASEMAKAEQAEQEEKALDDYVASLNDLILSGEISEKDARDLLEKFKKPSTKEKAHQAVEAAFYKFEEMCALQDPVLIRGSAMGAPGLTSASGPVDEKTRKRLASSAGVLFWKSADIVKTRKLLEAFSNSLDDLERCSAGHARKSSKG